MKPVGGSTHSHTFTHSLTHTHTHSHTHTHTHTTGNSTTNQHNVIITSTRTFAHSVVKAWMRVTQEEVSAHILSRAEPSRAERSRNISRYSPMRNLHHHHHLHLNGLIWTVSDWSLVGRGRLRGIPTRGRDHMCVCARAPRAVSVWTTRGADGFLRRDQPLAGGQLSGRPRASVLSSGVRVMWS